MTDSTEFELTDPLVQTAGMLASAPDDKRAAVANMLRLYRASQRPATDADGQLAEALRAAIEEGGDAEAIKERVEFVLSTKDGGGHWRGAHAPLHP